MNAMSEITPVTDLAIGEVKVGGIEAMPQKEQAKFQPLENEKREQWQAFAGVPCEKVFESLGARMESEVALEKVEPSQLVGSAAPSGPRAATWEGRLPQATAAEPSDDRERTAVAAVPTNIDASTQLVGSAALSGPQPIAQPIASPPIAQVSSHERVMESLRASAVAVVSAIQVSPTLATTGVGEMRIELSNEILDGSLVRFEVTKKGDLSITIHPATQETSTILEKNLETFQTHLAERVANWRVNVGVTAWSAKTNLKRTESEA